jgi:FMN phosphatase YigB (HAD superfamily)
MKRIKLISDFDGIWTNQEEEAKYMQIFILNILAGITGNDKREIETIINSINEEMNKGPHLYGWRYRGETPAFYGEDPFGDNNAFFDFIEQNYTNKKIYTNLQEIRRKILDTGFESLEQFSNYCFTESTTMFKEEGKLEPHTKAKETISKLMEKGVELVVASNSSTDKLEYLFGKLGHKMNEKIPDSHGEIRARGNSMKFAIDRGYTELPPLLEVTSNYKIPLRRKFYHQLLKEEKPDFVVGDVFSLDIALPLYLSLNDENFKGLKIIQKIQKYTPEWVKDYLKKEEFRKIVYMINDIEELPEIIKKSKD